MYLFIDTEFTDFGNKMDLMSLGIVSEDGHHEFYVEISDHIAEWRSDFVKQVVLPLMDMPKHGKSTPWAALDLVEWLDKLPGDEVTVVVDYVGDSQLFDKLLAQCPRKTTKKIHVKMLTYAFTHMLMSRGIHMNDKMVRAYAALMNETKEYFNIDPRQHHSLVDAKANRHGWLAGYEAGCQ